MYREIATNDNVVAMSYDEALDIIEDPKDIAKVDFLPALGSEVKLLENIGVTMTVEDHNGNAANCSFIYVIQRKFIALF